MKKEYILPNDYMGEQLSQKAKGTDILPSPELTHIHELHLSVFFCLFLHKLSPKLEYIWRRIHWEEMSFLLFKGVFFVYP